MECLSTLAKMSDNASKKDMQRLIDAKKDIETYMLAAKFMTEEVAWLSIIDKHMKKATVFQWLF